MKLRLNVRTKKIALSADGKEIYVSDISQSKAVLENEKQKKIGYDLKSIIKNLRREGTNLKAFILM